MFNRKFISGLVASLVIIGGVVPAFSQGILDRMKEDAARRAENKAIMDAEHPKDAAPAAAAATTANTTTAAAPAASTPATPASETAASTPAAPAPASAQ